MSYEHGTQHYNLPQTVGTDKRDWFDTNEAFLAIDSAIHTAVETAETGAENITALQTQLNDVETRVGTAENDIDALEGNLATTDERVAQNATAITQLDNKIADVKQDALDMICAFEEPSAQSTHAYEVGDFFRYNDILYKCTVAIAVDDTIVPNVNCSATNVTTELLSVEGGGGGSVTASAVSYDNTTSGLSATNVQSAIDEIISDIPDISTISTDVNTLKTNLTSDDVSFRFAIQGGDYGYLKADDSFVPFSTGGGSPFTITYLGYATNTCREVVADMTTSTPSLTYTELIQVPSNINSEYISNATTYTYGVEYTLAKPAKLLIANTGVTTDLNTGDTVKFGYNQTATTAILYF